jgi:hypothetical protein
MKAEALLLPRSEVEQATVEGQRLLDIADLEGDMVETDGARFFCLRHGGSPTIRAVIMWCYKATTDLSLMLQWLVGDWRGP